MNKPRRHFSGPDKVAILKRHLLEKVPVSDLCNELELQPSVFYQWQRQAFENLAAAFGTPATASGASKREKELATRAKELEAKLAKQTKLATSAIHSEFTV